MTLSSSPQDREYGASPPSLSHALGLTVGRAAAAATGAVDEAASEEAAEEAALISDSAAEDMALISGAETETGEGIAVAVADADADLEAAEVGVADESTYIDEEGEAVDVASSYVEDATFDAE